MAAGHGGMGFLHKKGFHPATFRNLEKVWLAESRVEDEKKRLEDYKRELDEERQIEELRRIQAERGDTVSQRRDRTLDWMYEGPAAQREEEKEEYLLGKVYQEVQANAEVQKIANGEVPGSLWLQKTKPDDMYLRIREDPLFMIKKEEKIAREKILSNPIRMKRIREQLEKDVKSKKSKKEKGKSKKKEKKRSSTSPVHSRKQRSRSRSRSRSPKHSHRSFNGKSIKSPTESQYGLLSKHQTVDSSKNEGLGPSAKMLAKRSEFLSKQVNSQETRVRLSELTEEEKAKRLEAMMYDAEVHDKARWNRLLKQKQEEKSEQDRAKKQMAPTFLNYMNKSSADVSVEERVRSLRHTRQKGYESHKFGN